MNRKQSLIDISILLKIYLKAADSNNANRDCSLAHCGHKESVATGRFMAMNMTE